MELSKLVEVNMLLFCFCHLKLITTEGITGIKSQQIAPKSLDGLEMQNVHSYGGGGIRKRSCRFFFEAHVKKGINYPKSTPYISVL